MKKQKAKKELNATQTKNKYRALQYTFFGSEFIAILTPYIILGAVNFEEWFATNESGWQVSLGASLALALFGIASFLIAKKKDGKTSITEGYITMIVGWFAVAFIFFLLASVMSDIAMIMFYGGLGMLGAFGLNIASNKMKQKANIYKAALMQAGLDEATEKVKKQVELAKKQAEAERTEPTE
jgi:hypothetical protein